MINYLNVFLSPQNNKVINPNRASDLTAFKVSQPLNFPTINADISVGPMGNMEESEGYSLHVNFRVSTHIDNINYELTTVG